jgi:hypothetical protein
LSVSTKNLEACRAYFCSETDTALERYKQGHEALERQVWDLEANLRRAHEVRRGAVRALEGTDVTMNALQCDMSRLEEENAVMVQQIVDLTKGL